jgi:phosphate transport system permease protein
VLIILFNAWPFFQEIPLNKFLLGAHWNPQTAELAGHKEISFGLLPLLGGTFLIAIIASIVALPIGLASSIYLAEFIHKPMKNLARSCIELLAGVPTVVYGYFAAIIVGPKIRLVGKMMDLELSSESALAAGVVMGIMIMPYITSLSEEVISSVPKATKDAAMALGLTRSETILHIVLPIAAPGIAASFLLALSRAIGETMIVAMAAGLSANMTLNPFESVTTITVQIVRLLLGDQEYGTINTSAAFALALILFFITFILSAIASGIISQYRKKYE